MNILITGCAGFVGFHTSQFFLDKGHTIYGIDNLNNYYDIKLKKNRLKLLKEKSNFIFFKNNLQNLARLHKYIKQNKISLIIHLAAQAGVRDSITNPSLYFENNVKVFFNILELCKLSKINLIYASSSSVYGDQKPMNEKTEAKPIQFYAATKKSNEIMADVYTKLYNFSAIGLRFFTVYGPYGRPDMSYFKFSDKLRLNRNIDIFNKGLHERDFTYVSDVVDCIHTAQNQIVKFKKKSLILNVGSGKKVSLKKLISLLEKNFQKKFKKKFIKKQIGDIKNTKADISEAKVLLNYNPKIRIEIGVKKFADWYKSYYNFR